MTYIDKYSREIQQLCRMYKVKSLYAFGSVLSEKFSDRSDIDFVVDFVHMELTDYADNYFNLKFSLEDVLERPVDLIEEKAIRNPYFKKTVDSQRKLVYGNRNSHLALQQ